MDLQDHLEAQWPQMYEFEIHRTGLLATYPQGQRQPCYVGSM